MDCHGRTYQLLPAYYTEQGVVAVKTDELEHLLNLLNRIKNPNADVDLAKAYVNRDIALRAKQRENMRENNRDYSYDLM